jgi:hypothetical protein
VEITKQNGGYYFKGPEEFCESFFEILILLHSCVFVLPLSPAVKSLAVLQETDTCEMCFCNWLQMILSSWLNMWDTFA